MSDMGHATNEGNYFYVYPIKIQRGCHGNTAQASVLLPRTGRKEGNVSFNDALNTFYLRLYGVGHMIKDHSDGESKEMFYLTMHSTHFIYSYVASDI